MLRPRPKCFQTLTCKNQPASTCHLHLMQTPTSSSQPTRIFLIKGLQTFARILYCIPSSALNFKPLANSLQCPLPKTSISTQSQRELADNHPPSRRPLPFFHLSPPRQQLRYQRGIFLRLPKSASSTSRRKVAKRANASRRATPEERTLLD